jgi:hypothetical protein
MDELQLRVLELYEASREGELCSLCLVLLLVLSLVLV